ncbi:MAG: hypothetical protein IH947_16085 [Bacteroidetes bacterium]|nr:hypothetical protein [Bacteroidota bacterium]
METYIDEIIVCSVNDPNEEHTYPLNPQEIFESMFEVGDQVWVSMTDCWSEFLLTKETNRWNYKQRNCDINDYGKLFFGKSETIQEALNEILNWANSRWIYGHEN